MTLSSLEEETPYRTGTVAEGSNLIFDELLLGTYLVVEIVPSGYKNENNQVIVTLSEDSEETNNSDITVNFTNIKDPVNPPVNPPVVTGRITITKNVMQGNDDIEDATEFTVNVYSGTKTGTPYRTGTVAEGNSLVFDNLPIGKYIVEEVVPSGYTNNSNEIEITFTGSNLSETVNFVNLKDEETEVDIPEEEIPGGNPDLPGDITPEEETEEDIVLDDEIPAGPANLPKTGGIPAGLFYGLGSIISLAGVLTLKKKK